MTKFNMDLSVSNCDYLINTALQNKNEYHIGIVKDKDEIIKAQTKLSGLQIENIESFQATRTTFSPS